MTIPTKPSRRQLLSAGALTVAAGSAPAGDQPPPANRLYRIGVISASIDGRAQRTNGHTWHFAQYFHPEVHMPSIRRHLDPGSARMFERYLRNPRYNFDQLPFPDTRITHVYADPADALTN